MNKKTQITIATVLGTIVFALPAFAATTASFTPASLKVSTGQQFNVSVMVDPAGTKNFAEKIEVNFPADTLEVSSFTLGNGAMALSQPGYDSVDNAGGVLVKTAGYAGGISSPTMFGTILFTAKKAGAGTITIGNQSMAFLANGQTTISGTGASFTVNASTVAPAKSPAKTLAPTSSINGKTVVATATPTTTADLAVASQVAAAGATTSGGLGAWGWILIIVIVLVLIGLYVRMSKKRN